MKGANVSSGNGLSFALLRKILVLVFFVALGFSLGYSLRDNGYIVTHSNFSLTKVDSYPKVTINRSVPLEKTDLDFSLFWKVWDILSSKYYDKSKLIDSELVYGAIRGMVSAVGDPYTSFFKPEENKIVQEDLQGSFGGVGINIHMVNNQLVVEAPVPGTPAERANIQAGDYILRIKDKAKNVDRDTDGISLGEAVSLIRGQVGTKVTLSLIREGGDEPFDVELTRAIINVPSVSLSFVGKDSNLAHLRVNKFAADTLKEWNDAISDIVLKRNVKGIVLDLRNNPGGYLTQAVDLGTDFLEVNDVVVIEDNGKTKKEYKVQKLGRLRSMPVVVLINRGSASASEILAGALRDHGRAKLIGENSFGKGTIQEPVDLNGGGGLHVTVAKWLTPKGVWVNTTGLTPDIKISQDKQTEADEQLEEAVKFLSG
ncbi:MAG: S41 family peptidase [Patescibacteria group bacterium]|nr:S41 family peptidase [Patescibacteria group bacterium]